MSKLVYVVQEHWLAEMLQMGLEVECEGQFRVKTFSSPDSALLEFTTRAERPEIVIASLICMGGLELCYQMKSRHREVKFLLTSGCPSSMVNEALEAAPLLPDAFLQAPFSIEEYLAVMRALVTGLSVPLGLCKTRAWPFNPLNGLSKRAALIVRSKSQDGFCDY